MDKSLLTEATAHLIRLEAEAKENYTKATTPQLKAKYKGYIDELHPFLLSFLARIEKGELSKR